MLEPMNLDKSGAMHFKAIQPSSTGTGIVYVTNGREKFSKVAKAFVVLYIMDADGAIIPGYIFNIEDFKRAGLELNAVTGHFVKIDYMENRFGNMGLTLIIERLALVVDPPVELFNQFKLSLDGSNELLQTMSARLSKLCGKSVRLPTDLVTLSGIGFYGGKLGGVLKHYSDMLDVIEGMRGMYSEEGFNMLLYYFIMFMDLHTAYVSNVEQGVKGKTMAALYGDLANMASKFSKLFSLGDGALEMPMAILSKQNITSVYGRIVIQVHQLTMQAVKESQLRFTLGLSQSGDAGYGMITRYTNED